MLRLPFPFTRRPAPAALLEREHQAVWAMLPWYVNQTLDAHERQRVERHLKDCLRCRGEVKLLQRVERTTREVDPAAAAMERSLQQLKERLPPQPERGLQCAAAAQRSQATAKGSSAKGNGWFGFRIDTLPSMRYLAMAQSLLLVVLAVALWRPPAPEAPYQTLSTPSELATQPEAGLWQVMFDPAASMGQVQSQLQQLSATIIHGPSPAGLYTLRLATSPASATAEEALQRLEAVRFAAPMTLPHSASRAER